MIYSQFLNKTQKHLKSVRILKNYVSFDMIFPSSWVMVTKPTEGIEILQNNTESGDLVTSFVCQNQTEIVNKIEELIDLIIKTNREREEKERLFKSKVQELKSIFEKENLESLKGLKFDMEELTKLMSSNGAEVSNGVATTTK
jgi:Ran GTPase-activating protein (RanGAP) involved in mRNA processing and transport